jgi:hypothetical protein
MQVALDLFDNTLAELEQRLAKVEKEKPDLDKYFEENIEGIIRKLNDYGVEMKIHKEKQPKTHKEKRPKKPLKHKRLRRV